MLFKLDSLFNKNIYAQNANDTFQVNRWGKIADPAVGLTGSFLGKCVKTILGALLLVLIFRPAAAQGPVKEMSDTVESLCPVLAGVSDSLTAAQRDVWLRCREVKIQVDDGQQFDDLTQSQTNALANMAGDEATIEQSGNIFLAGTQNIAIVTRLSALRSGGGGQLALNLNESPVDEPILLAGPISSLTPTPETQSSISDFGRLSAFVTGSISQAQNDASTKLPGFDYTGTGVTAGLDYRFSDRFISGLAAGYFAADTDIDNDAGDVETIGWALSLYGTYYLDQLYVNAIATAGWKDYELKRRINYSVARNANDPAADSDPNVTVDQTFVGESDATEYSLSLGGGYDMAVGGLTFGPYAGVNYSASTIDGFKEDLAVQNTNAGFGLALAYDEQKVESLTTNLGGQVSYAWATGIGIISPFARAEWEHQYLTDIDDINARFVNGGTLSDAIANNHIIIPTEDSDSDYFNLGVGTSATLPYGISAFVDYATILGLNDITYHQISGGVRIEI